MEGSHGVQEVTQYEPEGGGKATAALEISSNGGAFAAASISTSLSQVWEKGTEILAVF